MMLPTEPYYERSSKKSRDEFDARDLWSAAYLHARGLPFLHCYLYHGYTRWVFADRETAWDLSYQWRDGAPDALVHGPTLMLSYKTMALASRAAGFTHTSGRVEQKDAEHEHVYTNDPTAA